MYDENSFQNYIFWLKVKRVFLMIVLSIVGAIIGIILAQFLVDVLKILDSFFKVVIIAVSTLLFFGISLLLTANVGRDVQEGYWKMAVLRKLTVISKKLDALDSLGNLENLENLENLRSLKNLDKTAQLADVFPNMEPVKRTKTTRTTKTTKTPRKTTTKKSATSADEFEGFTVASDDTDQLFFQ